MWNNAQKRRFHEQRIKKQKFHQVFCSGRYVAVPVFLPKKENPCSKHKHFGLLLILTACSSARKEGRSAWKKDCPHKAVLCMILISNQSMPLYSPFSITTAFGLLLTSPLALQVMLVPVTPSKVMVVNCSIILSLISCAVISAVTPAALQA